MDRSGLAASALGAEQIRMLQDALAAAPDVTRAWLFGSRAKGTAGPSSDIDIAVEGMGSALQVEALRERLNELPLPYSVDVLALEEITNSDLRGHIDRCGVLLFERPGNPRQR